MSFYEWTYKMPQVWAELRRSGVPSVQSGRRSQRKKRSRPSFTAKKATRKNRVSSKKQSPSPGEQARAKVRRRLSSRIGRHRAEADRKRLESAQRWKEDAGRFRATGAAIKTIIALDLGRKTGYAAWCRGIGIVSAGTWELMSAKERKGRAAEFRRLDPGPKALHTTLQKLVNGLPSPALIVFEDVEFQSYTLQTQQWSAYRTATWLVDGVKYFDCVPVATLKMFATGYGNATKEMMADAFGRETMPIKTAEAALDDNAIDAFFILKWALFKYGL